jgi:hypothetical protein
VPEPRNDGDDIGESVLPLVGDEYAKLFHEQKPPADNDR